MRGWTPEYKEELAMEMAVETAERAAWSAAPQLPPSWLLRSPPPWRSSPRGRQQEPPELGFETAAVSGLFVEFFLDI